MGITSFNRRRRLSQKANKAALPSESKKVFSEAELKGFDAKKLRVIATEMGATGLSRLTKDALIQLILKQGK